MAYGVDIIVSASSDPGSIRRTLASLREQTHSGWRAILCAGPEEPAAIDPSSDPRLIIQTQTARTPSSAWNRALDQGDAEYVMVLNAGDELEPTALEALTAAAASSRSDGAVAAFGRLPSADQPGAPWTIRFGSSPHPRTITLTTLHEQGGIDSPACITNRSAFERKRFAVNLAEHALFDMQLRQAEAGSTWTVLEAPLARRLGRGSIADLANRAQRGEQVIKRALARAASSGFAAAGMDASPEREQALVTRIVFEHATLAALIDPEARKSKSTEIMRRLGFTPKISPDTAATTAAAALQRSMVADPASPEWMAALNHWWNRVLGEKWAEPRLIDAARDRLAAKLTPDDDIAAAVLNASEAGTAVHAIGDPTHIDTIARILHSRPKPPALTRLDPSAIADGPGRSVLSEAVPIIIATDDEEHERELLAALGGRGNLHRWRSISRRLIDENARRLTRAWLRQPQAV